jgi:hypothetical protein
MADTSGSQIAFIEGNPDADSSIHCYVFGAYMCINTQHCLIAGGTTTSDSSNVYLYGNTVSSGSTHVYVTTLGESVLEYVHGYCTGILRDTIHVCISGGVLMTAVDYIWLKTSDNGVTLSKKFRVIAQDYDDGTKEKAETVDRTIGGGVDHSVGSVYTTWSPIIRVRAEESETDYGNKSDLEYFYDLVNPNATPSNDVTFIDHHQIEYVVHLVGRMTKNLMGSSVEGTEAWYLYRLSFLKVK